MTVNCRVIPVAGYATNICRFSKDDLVELDMVIKRKLRNAWETSYSVYLPRSKGGRGIKSMRDLYKETKVQIAYYMAMSRSIDG